MSTCPKRSRMAAERRYFVLKCFKIPKKIVPLPTRRQNDLGYGSYARVRLFFSATNIGKKSEKDEFFRHFSPFRATFCGSEAFIALAAASPGLASCGRGAGLACGGY